LLRGSQVYKSLSVHLPVLAEITSSIHHQPLPAHCGTKHLDSGYRNRSNNRRYPYSNVGTDGDILTASVRIRATAFIASGIEVVGIFENLYHEIGMGRRKRPLEVRESSPFSLVRTISDLMDQNVSAPSVLDRRAKMPFPSLTVLEAVQPHTEMTL
jgi:hypothetical protein